MADAGGHAAPAGANVAAVAKPTFQLRDRIKEFVRVPASSIVPSDDNFRRHPEKQKSAMRALLSEIGFAGAVLTRRREDGRLVAIDGHMRNELLGDELVPTLVTDLNAEEARLLIAAHDAVGDMAVIDPDHLKATLATLTADHDELNVVLLELSGHSRGAQDQAKVIEAEEKAARGEQPGPPEMELRPYEHYDYVLVLARKTTDWNALAALLKLERVDSSPAPTVKKIGIGRCIDAGVLLQLLATKDHARSK